MRTARWLVCGSLLCGWGAVEDHSAIRARSIQSSVLVERTVFGRALRGNQFAETLNRKILVYLPPGYHAPANRHRRYPVVYLLAGLGGDHRNFAADGTPNRIAAGRPQMIGLGLDMQEIADQLIANNAIDEAILVGVSGMNTLSSHWFACSEVIGDYRSHVARDIVRYVDRNFRTRRNRNHRALIGHSSGAFGALSLAIEYPHKFGAVAVLGPAGNDLAAAVPPSAVPRLIQLFFLANPTAIGDPVLMPVDGSPIPDGPFWELWGTTPAGGKFINNAIFSLAGAYSPHPNIRPFSSTCPSCIRRKLSCRRFSTSGWTTILSARSPRRPATWRRPPSISTEVSDRQCFIPRWATSRCFGTRSSTAASSTPSRNCRAITSPLYRSRWRTR